MTDLAAEFTAHRGALFGLAYRMLGTVPDADEVVQDAFVRALQSKPDDSRPLRPWLFRVTANAARDRLRRRRARHYPGPWVPGPIDLDDARLADDAPSPEARYARRESLSFAFLLALEALTPNRRAVLLLRDVYDCSVRETADALGMSESNVKTTLHRARRTLAQQDIRETPATPEMHARALGALAAFGDAARRGDVEALVALMRDDAVLLGDGGGVHRAAARPVVGAVAIARLYVGLARSVSDGLDVQIRMLNGAPAALATDPGVPEGFAKRWVLRCEIDPDGRIAAIHSILAPDKVAGVT